MLYWVTGAIGLVVLALLRPPAWPLAHQREAPRARADRLRVVSLRDPPPPRAWAERVYDIRRWTTMPAGGHFAALEEPESLAADGPRLLPRSALSPRPGARCDGAGWSEAMIPRSSSRRRLPGHRPVVFHVAKPSRSEKVNTGVPSRVRLNSARGLPLLS